MDGTTFLRAGNAIYRRKHHNERYKLLKSWRPMSGVPNHDNLFRRETFLSREKHIHGPPLLDTPIPSLKMTAFIVSLITTAIAILISGEYSATQSVRGITITSIASAKIFPPYSGVVKSIFVKEGQYVRQGQRIAMIDTERLTETGDSTTQQDLNVIRQRMAILESKKQIQSEKNSMIQGELSLSIGRSKRNIENIDAQISAQLQIVASRESVLTRLEPAYKKGFVSYIQHEQSLQNYLLAKQALSALEQQKVSESETEARLTSDLKLKRQEAMVEIADLANEKQQIVQERNRDFSTSAYSIASPISGVVMVVNGASGRQARQDQSLFEIAPSRSKIAVELYAPSRSVGRIKVGQKVRMSYDAYPYETYGSFPASVKNISRSSVNITDLNTSIKSDEPIYRIECSLDKYAEKADHRSIVLRPGMMVTAKIVTQRRSFLNWILSPLEGR